MTGPSSGGSSSRGMATYKGADRFGAKGLSLVGMPGTCGAGDSEGPGRRVRLDLNAVRAVVADGVALTGVSAGATTFEDEDDVLLAGASAGVEVLKPFWDWPARVKSSACKRASKEALFPLLNEHLR